MMRLSAGKTSSAWDYLMAKEVGEDVDFYPYTRLTVGHCTTNRDTVAHFTVVFWLVSIWFLEWATFCDSEIQCLDS